MNVAQHNLLGRYGYHTTFGTWNTRRCYTRVFNVRCPDTQSQISAIKKGLARLVLDPTDRVDLILDEERIRFVSVRVSDLLENVAQLCTVSFSVEAGDGGLRFTHTESRVELLRVGTNRRDEELRQLLSATDATVHSPECEFAIDGFEWFSFNQTGAEQIVYTERHEGFSEWCEAIHTAFEHFSDHGLVVAWDAHVSHATDISKKEVIQILKEFDETAWVFDPKRELVVSDRFGRITLFASPNINAEVRYELGARLPFRRSLQDALGVFPAEAEISVDFEHQTYSGTLYTFEDRSFEFVSATPIQFRAKTAGVSVAVNYPKWSAVVADEQFCDGTDPHIISGFWCREFLNDPSAQALMFRWGMYGPTRGEWQSYDCWEQVAGATRAQSVETVEIFGASIRNDQTFFYAVNEALFGAGCFVTNDHWLTEDIAPGTKIVWHNFDASRDNMTLSGLLEAFEYLYHFDVHLDGEFSTRREFLDFLNDDL